MGVHQKNKNLTLSIFRVSNPRGGDPSGGKRTVWHRMDIYETIPDGKTLVFGHTPTMWYQDNDPMEIFYGNNMIGIDCGCAYVNGRLACLRLDDGAVFYSE